MLKYIAFVVLLFANNANSECNFITADYIRELSNPVNISLIEIEVPKTEKYLRNAFKIMTSETTNIPPKLRKNFTAMISVHYKFGLCKYTGRIRQHGDWKDHISIRNGEIIRSLDIKINDGNILNSISFKLLLPDTRNSMNEILASLIFKKLNFISPETFEVKTSVNDVKAIMLFQEKAKKELLEKNYRREGPIFEGDESLLWSNLDQDEDLKLVSLSRLVNDKWFEKGNIAQEIIIKSFKKLQLSHLKSRYIYDTKGNEFIIFPNLLDNNNFVDFHLLLIAMNAEHAFYINNRKYFFNTLESTFEPIYYDADPNFLKKSFSKKFFDLTPKNPSDDLLEKVLNINKNDSLRQDFYDRTIGKKTSEYFFTRSLENFSENISNLTKIISKNNKNQEKNSFVIPKKWYEMVQKSTGVEQQILEEVKLENGSYKGSFINGRTLILSKLELAEIFSKNRLGNKRVVYIPKNDGSKNEDVYYLSTDDVFITMSKGMQIELNKEKKTIKFKQINSNDWALISESQLTDWQIFFEGTKPLNNENKVLKERFNNYGLTGCLTLYKSELVNTFISTKDGKCEDSINLINSYGSKLSIVVKNAFADALDADFSNLSFSSLNINHADNDCLDVSRGTYNVEHAVLNGCKDKAISIGEKSSLVSQIVYASNSKIAVSAKDLSEVKIYKMITKNIEFCAEVKQKKQEFGGAKLSIKDFKCSATLKVDLMSKFERDIQ